MTIPTKSTGLAKYLQGIDLWLLFFHFCAKRFRNMTIPLLLRGSNSNAGSATLRVSGSKDSSLLSPLCLICKTWTVRQTHKSV